MLIQKTVSKFKKKELKVLGFGYKPLVHVIFIIIYMCCKINFISLFFLILFVFGCDASSLLHGLFSSCGERTYCLVAIPRLLIAVASLIAEHRLCVLQAQQFSSRALEHMLSSCDIQEGLVALRHVGSCRIRNRTPVPCNGRWILYH